MLTSVRSLIAPCIERLLIHLRVPLYRNGYALVINSAATSGLGMLYWILAARYYSTEAIGLNSAIVSSVMLLANISQLNLTNTLNRFIPRAGRATGHLVIYAYIISAVVGLVTSFIFAVGVGLWASELSFLKSSPLFITWFTLSTMAWCVLVLQDSALTGLRQAPWIPLQNLVFALLRIVLVISFATALPQFGVFASWIIPLLCLLPLTNMLLFGRLIPRHARATEDRAIRILPSQVIRYVSADYLASLIWMATINLLPLMILERAGPSANAYFFLPWTISYSLYLISLNMGMSLVAEAANDETKLSEYSSRALVQTTRLLLPTVIIFVLGAPYILALFGESYADEGTLLLRLLCLSAIPHMLTSLYISHARVQRRMMRVFLVLTFLSGLTFALSYILLDLYSITGVAVALLLSETIVAIALLFTQQSQIWLSHFDMNSVVRLLAIQRSLRWRWTSRRRLNNVAKLVSTILPAIPPVTHAPPPTTWRLQRIIPTVNEVAVIALGPKGYPPVAVLKLPQTDYAAVGLQRQSAVLRELHSNQQLGNFRSLLPTLLLEGKISDQPYFVEKILPGRDALDILFNPTACTRFQAAAAAAIGEFHQRTASPVSVDEGLLQRWVDEPLSMVEHITRAHMQDQSYREAIHRMSDELHSALTGRTYTVSWIHGDFTPKNILVTPGGTSVTGIIDWDQSAPKELPQLDLVLLLLSTRLLVQRRELGDIIRDLLRDDGWKPHEQALLDEAHLALPGDAVEMRPVVLLTWLRHVVSNLSKSTSYAKHRLWVAKNIDYVLYYI
jgi:O-antigen/teichoic acid export membrane protein